MSRSRPLSASSSDLHDHDQQWQLDVQGDAEVLTLLNRQKVPSAPRGTLAEPLTTWPGRVCTTEVSGRATPQG